MLRALAGPLLLLPAQPAAAADASTQPASKLDEIPTAADLSHEVGSVNRPHRPGVQERALPPSPRISSLMPSNP